MSTFFVSLTGSDSNNGTSAGTAFATLDKARAAMAASSGADITTVAGGTYAQPTINMTSANNGDTFTVAAGQTAILDHGGAATPVFSLSSAPNVTISGFTIQNVGDQGDASGTIYTLNSAGDVISGNTFKNVVTGVFVDGGSSKALVSGNTFSNIGYSAVILNENTTGNTVTQNNLSHIGFNTGEGAAIIIWGSQNNVVSHNNLNDIAYNGIGEWNYFISDSGNNTIAYNKITDSVKMTNDGGAIYTFINPDVGDRWYNNYIDGTGGTNGLFSFGLYMDDTDGNTDVQGNFVKNAHDGMVMVHGGDNNNVVNNVGIGGTYLLRVQDADDQALNENIHHNLVVAPGAVVGADQPAAPFFHDNVYVTPGGSEPAMGFDFDTWQTWRSWGGDPGTNLTASAGFTNEAAGDYSFAAGSLALQEGIHSLDFGNMGLTTDGNAGDLPGGPTGSGDPPPPPPPDGDGTVDTLTIVAAGQYSGANNKPTFIVKVDGQQLGGTTTITTKYSNEQNFNFMKDWTAGTQHTIDITDTNPTSNRTMWLNDIGIDNHYLGPLDPTGWVHLTASSPTYHGVFTV